MTDEDTDYADFDSGPYCRHWRDPLDCEDRCLRCGHRCYMHEIGPRICRMEDGCACEAWRDSADEASADNK